MAPMIFGSKENFAIEATLLNRHKSFVFGHLVFWLNGYRLGDPKKTVDLDICFEDLLSLVRQFNKYHDHLISYLEPLTVLQLIKAIGAVDVERVPYATIETFKHFQRFVVSADFGGAIDEYLVMVTVDGEIMRFVWSKLGTQEDKLLEDAMEGHVTKDQLILSVKDFCAWYETLVPNTPSLVKPW